MSKGRVMGGVVGAHPEMPAVFASTLKNGEVLGIT